MNDFLVYKIEQIQSIDAKAHYMDKCMLCNAQLCLKLHQKIVILRNSNLHSSIGSFLVSSHDKLHYKLFELKHL